MIRSILLIGLLGWLAAPAYAQNEPAEPPAANAPAAAQDARDSGVDLRGIIERVAAATDRKIVIDPRVRASVQLGNAAVEDVTYPMLLSILRVHGFFAHELDGYTLVLPSASARSMPLRVLQRDDTSVSDDEYVTRVLTVRGLQAVSDDGTPAGAYFVPVLRPLVGVEGHLAAFDDKLIVVDRYDNVRRITAIIETLDR